MTATDRPASIALFGTFDVENYGDLLFPHLVQHALCRASDVLNIFSPLGGELRWNDTIVARPVREAATSRPDLCLVGGGNIVTARSTPLPAYAPLGPALPLAYASLWLGAAVTAAITGARLAWNAPGLPAPVTEQWAAELVGLATSACDYLATRDQQSRSWLQARCPVSVVPDVALGISQLWGAQELRRNAQNAFLSRGVPLPDRWIVFHFNSRYLDGGLEESAAAALRISRSLDALPVLLAIGPCHGDDALARAASVHLQPCLVVDRPDGLKEIAALIAHSIGYVGSSLHGLISALSYRRPALAVARTAMPKFRGFLDQVDMPHRLVESWAAASSDGTLTAPLASQELSAIDRSLRAVDVHWVRIRGCLDRPNAAAAAARSQLLREVRLESARWPEWQTLHATMGGPAPFRKSTMGSPAPSCPICGGTEFGSGPGGRMSRTGRPPRCATCGALERHRIFRLIFDGIRSPAFRSLSCLMFSRDQSVATSWFGHHEYSIFGGNNSLDLQRIERPDASYDVVVCNHVLEHVADYRSALRELVRITRPGGFVFLSVPTPISREKTNDWGFPRADQHGHFRIFGRDIETVFAAEMPDHQVIAVTARDPATGTEDMAYLRRSGKRPAQRTYRHGSSNPGGLIPPRQRSRVRASGPSRTNSRRSSRRCRAP
jgi:SAM-dependent methyltransferase/polysaccharide pyruvyl transferase WcaK-like protein